LLQFEYGWTSRTAALEGLLRRLAASMPLGLETPRALLRMALASGAFCLTLAVMALNQHGPMGIQPGVLARSLAIVVPPLAAAVAALAIARPWQAYLLILLLTPVWDAAQVAWQIGQLQVIAQTVFVAALIGGLALSDRVARGTRSDRLAPRATGWLLRGAALASAAFLALAILSTLASPDFAASFNVLQHGIVEPMAMGVLLIALGPSRRRLAQVAVVLGLSVAIGSVLNIVQTVPGAGSLATLQAQRLLFSRLTYYNVGLFGELLAMAVPLLLGAFAARRYLGLSRGGAALLVVAVAACSVGLFLTFSKSAWLASSVGALVVCVLLARTWRRRAAIVLAATMVSALVVPWPALVLQTVPAANGAYRGVMVALVGASRFDSWNPATPSGRGSLTERLLASAAAVRMAADHPLLGIGLNQYKTDIHDYRLPEARLAPKSAHNFWPEIAAELGLPALLLVVLIFGLALTALWRTYRAPPDEQTRVLAATLMASLLAWLVVATTFDPDLYRFWRNMASDMVMMAVITAAAFALWLVAREPAGSPGTKAAVGAGEVDRARSYWLRSARRPEDQKPSWSRMRRIRRAALPRWEMLFFASADQRPSVRPPGGSLAGSKIGS
jgi:O-antigen ligase